MITLAAIMIASTIGQAETTAEKKKDAVVCRRETPVGSRVPARRVCMKKSQWTARSTKVNRDGAVIPQWQGGAGYSPRSN